MAAKREEVRSGLRSIIQNTSKLYPNQQEIPSQEDIDQDSTESSANDSPSYSPLENDKVYELLVQLSSRAENWTKTSHYVSTGSAEVIEQINNAFPNAELGPFWNIAMILLGEIISSFPPGWEKELAHFSNTPQMLHFKLLEMSVEVLRSKR